MRNELSMTHSDGRRDRAEKMRESRRTSVIESAQQLFAQRGYHATSISDVIEHAGIARGTFYQYFNNKRAIFEEILDRFLHRLQDQLPRIEIGPGRPDALVQLQDNIERVLFLILEDEALPRIILQTAVGLDESFDQKLSNFYDEVTHVIDKSLNTGIKMELLRPHDTGLCSKMVLGSMKEILILLLNDVEFRNSIPDISKNMIEITLRGIIRQ